ncbi:MAG: DUF262 domain-containing protein [Deltaproteobacteria bacterium]|nr:DUF262 domain-containing protein [Deltaproteobacteria bacterium]
MAFQTPLTIVQAIDCISKKIYLLPAIQRELVWDTEQIELLFDSLMRDYPIGSFLFWKVDKENITNYQFYEFIKDYHERDTRHNLKADMWDQREITAILDGQQRLTALYIGLRGKYSYKIPYLRYDSVRAFPERELYLNLLKPNDKIDEINKEYDFRFLTKEESQEKNNNYYWFKVGDIINLREEFAVSDYLLTNNLMTLGDLSRFANKTLFKLHSIIFNKPIINYYLESDQSLDKVLNIFIRINSAGTPLSYSDLLLSIASAQWETKDARQEINKFVDELNKIDNKFNFDKNIVLKSFLVLLDFTNIAFKVDNFNKKNMLLIENEWENISFYIKLAVDLVKDFGFNRSTLVSNTAIIPIAYYLLKKRAAENFLTSSFFSDDRKKIKKWLNIALLKRFFGGQPDNVLRPIRNIIREDNLTFPLERIVEHFKGKAKSLSFTDEEIEDFFFYKYGDSYTFSLLSFFYPTLDYKNNFHIDHIFPKDFFTKRKLVSKGIPDSKIDYYLDNVNKIANLQLIEGTINLEKSNKDFKDWLESEYKNEVERKQYCDRHFIPNNELDISNFENFIKGRKKLMVEKLKKELF